MAALTETQLQSACRAKLPITVVRDEDYTTMTPAEIAAEWSAYSGGTDNVYLQNIAGVWAEMDPDLPKANDRGLYVGGGGKQYAEDLDYSGETEGNAPTFYKWLNGTTCVVQDIGTKNGLPYIELAFSGTPTLNRFYVSTPPGWTKVPHADFAAGDIAHYRYTIENVSVPGEISAVNSSWEQYAASVLAYTSYGTGLQEYTAEKFWSVINGGVDIQGLVVNTTNQVNTELSSPFVVRILHALNTINMATPSHVHFHNTTTDPLVVIPEIMQRPWEYEGPWSVEIEFTTPPRNLGGSLARRILNLGGNTTDFTCIYWNTADNKIGFYVEKDNASQGDVTTKVVAANTTTKVVIYQTAQITRCFVEGVEYMAIPEGRTADTVETLGALYNGTANGFMTFKSYKYRRGLATTAQLIEWSTLS